MQHRSSLCEHLAKQHWYGENGSEHHLEHEEDVLHIVVPGNRLQDRAQCGEKN